MDKLIRKISSSLLALLLVLQNCTGLVFASKNLDEEVNSKSVIDLNYEDISKDDPTLEIPSDSEVWVETIEDDKVNKDEDTLSDLDDNYKAMGDSLNKGEALLVSLPNTSYKPSDKLDISGIEILVKDENGKLNLLTDADLLLSDYIRISPSKGESLQGFYYNKLFDSDFLKNESDELKYEIDDYLRENNIKEQEEKVRIDIPGIESLEFDLQISDDDLDLSPMELFRALKMSKNSMALLSFDKFTLTKDEDLSYDNLRVLAKDSEGGLQILGKDELEIDDVEFLKEKEDFKKNAKKNAPPTNTFIEIKKDGYKNLYLPVSLVYDKNSLESVSAGVDLFKYGVKSDDETSIYTIGLDIRDLKSIKDLELEFLDESKSPDNISIEKIVKTDGKNEEDLSLTDGSYRGIDDKDLAKAADYKVQNPIKLSDDLSAGNKYVIFIKAKEDDQDTIYTRIKSKGLHNTSDKEIKLGAKELTHTTTLKGEEESDKTPIDNKEDLEKPSKADPENLASEEVSPENQDPAEQTSPEVNQAEPTDPSLEENKPGIARLNNALLATSNLEGSTTENPTDQILGSDRLKQLSFDGQNSATLTQANPTPSSVSKAPQALATNRGLFLNLLATNGGRALDINNSDIRVENVDYEILQEGDPYKYGPDGKPGLSVNPATGAAMQVQLDIVFNESVGKGDYFYFQAADGIDTRGIVTDEDRSFDIKDRSGRKIAVVEDVEGTRDTKKITFEGDFDSAKIHLDMVIYPDRYEVTSSGYVTPTLMVAGKEEKLPTTYYNYPNPHDVYPSRSFGIINKYHTKSKEFEALIYANHKYGSTNTTYPLRSSRFQVFNSPATNPNSYKDPTADIENIEIYAVPASVQLPEGIAVDDDFLNNNGTLLYDDLPKINSKSGSYIVPINYSGYDQLVIRVKGKHLDGQNGEKDLDIKYNFINSDGYRSNFTTWNMVKYRTYGSGSGEIREPETPPVTPPSEVKTGGFTITKKSTDGTILQGASFVLEGLDGSYQKELTTNSQGKVTFDNLKPGSYTLTESKAPDGYQKNSSSTSITVNNDGSISWTNGGLIKNEYTSQTTSQSAYVDSFKTSPQTVVGSTGYPDYMNAISYADVSDPQSQKVTYYLMLKPNSDNGASGTNRNTRLNLEGENLDITSVKLYDIYPEAKSTVADWMRNQSFQLSYIEYNPITLSSGGDGHNYPIKYYQKKYDSQLRRRVDSQIYLPSQRFGSDWSFMVAVEGKVQDRTKESSITYNWFTDDDPVGQVSIWNQKTTIKALYTESSGSTGHINPSFDVTNKPNPVEVYGKLTINKKDKKDNIPLGGAKFLLKSINSGWSKEGTTDQAGKLTFDQIPKGEYILSETKAPEGYKESATKWKVYVNSKGQTSIYEMGDINQPDTGGSNETSSNLGQDVSSKIQIKSSSMTYNDKNSNGSIDLYTDENQININLKMAVDGKVSPGDYFEIEESDTLHYNMAQYDKINYPPIASPTGEIIAIPQLSVDNLEKSTGKKIKYVFTDYIEGLDNLTMSLDWEHAVNPNAAKYDGDYKFELKIDDRSVSETFKVKYQDPKVKDHVSINTAYPYVNDQIGKYTQYAYINPLKNNLSGTSTIRVYTAYKEGYENSADLAEDKTDIKLYKYISNETLPDAIIYEEGKWKEVDPSTYKISYGSRPNSDGSVQTYAEFDVKGINTDTYLVKVDSELKDTTADQPIVGQFVEVTNNGVFAYKGNAIVRTGSSGQGDGDLQDSEIDIYNEKIDNPKKGRIKVFKKDENDKALAGVEFELRRKSTNELIATKTTDENGEIVFENLDQDIYLLIETKTKEGYILHEDVEVKLAENLEIPENNNPRDLSDQISLSINDYGTDEGSNITTVYPNSAGGLYANLTYNFPEGVKGGDYFYLQLSDEIDLEGIARNVEKTNSSLDIISSRGTVAKAQYDREKKRIKYTFTSYADDYELTKADVSLSTFVDRYVVKNNRYINPSFTIGQSTQSISYYVNYEDFYITNGDLSIGSFITQLDYSDNSYTQYVYVNYPENSYVQQTYLDIQSFSESPETSSGYFTEDDLKNVDMWVVDPKTHMPASWGVDESTLGQALDKGLYRDGYLTGADSDTLNSSNFGYWWTPGYEGRSIRLETDQLLNSYPGKALIIRVKGHFDQDDQGTDLNARASLYQGFGVSPTSYITYDNYNKLYRYDASSEGNITPESIPEVEVNLINKPNEIEFTKLGIGEISSDQANEEDYVKLEGVEFTLQKKSEAGTFEDYRNATSNESGKISFSKLPQGEYQLIETKTNQGYILPNVPVSKFKVGQDGKISLSEGYTTTITNYKAEYPATGGWGSFIYTMLGLMLATIAILGAKKREVID